jgi:hypothetical protein
MKIRLHAITATDLHILYVERFISGMKNLCDRPITQGDRTIEADKTQITNFRWTTASFI